MAKKSRRSIVAAATTSAACVAALIGASTANAASAIPTHTTPTHTTSFHHPASWRYNTPMGAGMTPRRAGRQPDVGPRPAGLRPATASTTPYGLDVSSYQGDVDWTTVKNDGASFAYIKATQSTDYTNPDFAQQYDGSYDAGLIRGAYEFAIPSASTGAAQADYFVAHGGGWSSDGKTLPGAVDLESGTSSGYAECYGMSDSGMVSWILSFSNEYHAKEGVYPVIYTSTSWWSTCTGNTGAFASTNPLWLASWNSSPGAMPYNWGYETFWQYADSGTFPGDQDLFNGTAAGLEAIAKG